MGLCCNPLAKTVKHDVLSFRKNDLECQLYLAEYTHILAIGSPGEVGKSRSFSLIYAISLPFVVSPVFVESRTSLSLNNIVGTTSINFPKVSRVNLEGDFNYYFRVFASDKNQMDSFVILAPDIMALILEAMGDYNIEFAGSRIYLSKDVSYVVKEPESDNIGINCDLKTYQELLEIGEKTCELLSRSARSAAVADPSSVVPLWKSFFEQPQNNLQKIFLQFKFLFYLIASIIFWPILLIFLPFFVIWLLGRYFTWEKRKRLFLSNWANGGAKISIKLP